MSPKYGRKWIPIVWESRTSQGQVFLISFPWSKNPYNSQNMGKVNSHSTAKVWENAKHYKIMGFLNISREAEILAISKTWVKPIPIVRENYGNTQLFQRYGFLTYFAWNRNPCNSENMKKVNSHSKGNVWENTSIPKLYFKWSVNPYNFQNMRKLNSHSDEKICENTNISKLRIS